ncbi:MAG: LysE family transporter [Proteobacteria bacterium]|nr:LysE family transporter [Pseudomonadota bacterium]
MFIEKILLGISLSAPIGPVSIEMIKRGLQKGFWGAFVVRLGGAVGNTLCLIAAYFGLGLLIHSEKDVAICSLAGSLVLMYLGIKSLFDKRKHEFSENEDNSIDVLNGMFTGFILSIANPIGLLFWVTIFAATLDHVNGVQNLEGLFENSSIILGVLIWGAFLSGLLEIGKRVFNNKLISWITTVAGLMLFGFGLKFAYKAISLLA